MVLAILGSGPHLCLFQEALTAFSGIASPRTLAHLVYLILSVASAIGIIVAILRKLGPSSAPDLGALRATMR